MEWKTIDSVPKGQDVILYFDNPHWIGFQTTGSYNDFLIPFMPWLFGDKLLKPYTGFVGRLDERYEKYIKSGYKITHWMPLPNPPTNQTPTGDGGSQGRGSGGLGEIGFSKGK